MIPVSIIATIVRTYGQYILIKAGGEMVKSVVEAYTPIPVVNQPSLTERVVKVVIGSVSAAGASSAVSKYLGGGSSKQVKRIDDLEMKLGEEVKELKESIVIVKDKMKESENSVVRLIDGVDNDLEEERMINSLYRAISAYLDLYIKRYPQYERLEWVRFMLNTQFDTLNLKALFRVEGLLENMSDVKDIDYFCDVLLFHNTVKALNGDSYDTPNAIDFVRENANKRVKELEDIKKAYEDDSVEAGQKLNEEYLEKHEYAKVVEDYEKECEEVEKIANDSSFVNVGRLISEEDIRGEITYNLRKWDEKRSTIWEGRPYKGDEIIEDNVYEGVVKEYEELNRQLESLNEPQNVVISCPRDGSMEITGRKIENNEEYMDRHHKWSSRNRWIGMD